MKRAIKGVLDILGLGQEYICPECGDVMVFETEDSLVCENCGYGTDVDEYGFTDKSYEELYPTKADVLMEIGEYEEDEVDEDNDTSELYDEVCGELDDD